jgi:hypothetical protein
LLNRLFCRLRFSSDFVYLQEPYRSTQVCEYELSHFTFSSFIRDTTTRFLCYGEHTSRIRLRNVGISITKGYTYFVAVLMLRFDSKQTICIHIIIMLAWKAFDINTRIYVVKHCLQSVTSARQVWTKLDTDKNDTIVGPANQTGCIILRVGNLAY